MILILWIRILASFFIDKRGKEKLTHITLSVRKMLLFSSHWHKKREINFYLTKSWKNDESLFCDNVGFLCTFYHIKFPNPTVSCTLFSQPKKLRESRKKCVIVSCCYEYFSYRKLVDSFLLVRKLTVDERESITDAQIGTGIFFFSW